MPGVMLGQPADDGACAVNQLAPEVVVGASSDTAESWLAPGGILSRHQPDPRCHLTARAKLAAIVDGGDDRCGDDRSSTSWAIRSGVCTLQRRARPGWATD